MPHFASGVVRFQETVFPEKRPLFEKLALGQAPEALFITCSDSRIETAMITQTEPGELFVCRNAGNIVPPHSKQTGGITASIEFAVSVLKVPHIVVCGHTECGAMKGAMNPESVASLEHVSEWLGHARAAVSIANELGKDLDDAQRMWLLLKENVKLQLQHLRTHPSVALALATGNLKLHGWVYDIKSGEVAALAQEGDQFLPVRDRYAAEIARLLDHRSCAA